MNALDQVFDRIKDEVDLGAEGEIEIQGKYLTQLLATSTKLPSFLVKCTLISLTNKNPALSILKIGIDIGMRLERELQRQEKV